MRSARHRRIFPVEYFDVVDDRDRVVGRKPGRKCLEEGLLHRAIAILLFDERGAIYVQKRADWMGWYPGHWTLSVMGHVSSGETYHQAARRELREELGVRCRLKLIAKVKTPDWRYGDQVEREYLAVFEGHAVSPRITFSEETKEGRFVRFEELVRMAKEQHDELTPDSLLVLNVYQRASAAKVGTD